MGLCFVECSFRAPLAFIGPGYPVQTHRPVPLRARDFNNLRFPGPGRRWSRPGGLPACLFGLFALAAARPPVDARGSNPTAIGTSKEHILIVQGNIANTYQGLGRLEEASRMRRDVYSGHLKLHGEDHKRTLISANNYAHCLLCTSPASVFFASPAKRRDAARAGPRRQR
jgi:hypothetical protein